MQLCGSGIEHCRTPEYTEPKDPFGPDLVRQDIQTQRETLNVGQTAPLTPAALGPALTQHSAQAPVSSASLTCKISVGSLCP